MGGEKSAAGVLSLWVPASWKWKSLGGARKNDGEKLGQAAAKRLGQGGYHRGRVDNLYEDLDRETRRTSKLRLSRDREH